MGDIRRSERRERAKESSRRYLVRIFIAIGVIVALIAGWAALYNSPAFSIEDVQVEGVEHLTAEEMSQLANVPSDTTLLRVDTETIRSRLMQTAWVADASVTRVFPSTLKITVTEREIEAIVEIPNRSGSATKKWAIAKDHIWLMPIPDPGTEAAKTTSAKIYEDAETALHITDVPYGTSAEIGQTCQDSNVNNALDIISGMTTDLANHIVTVSAAGPAETTLLLDSGVEIAFGKAENIRDKERVILQILDENPDSVAYINVRLVETPTWRSI
ncbi:MAG: FtsQ-type POTRA domain-containing protein [Eggerthellaceae bacterium]|nr:FtsQ-type POTRA domain-containing protein [Eggerthellaceae bacterium]